MLTAKNETQKKVIFEKLYSEESYIVRSILVDTGLASKTGGGTNKGGKATEPTQLRKSCWVQKTDTDKRELDTGSESYLHPITTRLTPTVVIWPICSIKLLLSIFSCSETSHLFEAAQTFAKLMLEKS